MSFQRFKLLSFDVMGTLIDYERGILTYIRQCAGAAASRLSDRDILEACARAEEQRQKAAPHLPFTRLLAPIYDDMALELGLTAGGDAAEGLRNSVADWPAFPDSVAALRRLGRHFRLVALTNADNQALDHMARTLGDPFDDRTTAEDVGVSKPDPQVFAYCRGRQSTAGYGLADWLHVAQSQYHDIGVAKALGFTVAWIERRKGEEGAGATPRVSSPTKPDYHFASLAELADVVERCV
ncbi:MAG: HAD-IA family hydrolase [Alphaproteobacteria bacterium]